jgi:hypothetical protein
MDTDSTYQVNSARDALALLSRQIYYKYGAETLPIISEVWCKLGESAGKRLREKLQTRDPKAVVEAFYGQGGVEVVRAAGEMVEVRGTVDCPLGLENTSRELCEAMMTVDVGMWEAVMERRVNMDIVTTRAAGDEYCDIIYSWG